MILTVVSCEYQENGARRVYRLSNDSVVVDNIRYPASQRFHYYNASGNQIYRLAFRQEMRKAIERHNQMWRLKT